jgi:predicted nuclease of predicted toxin-antitoxin system
MVLVSKDQDFLHLASRPEDPGRLLWVRIRNCRTAELLTAFEAGLPKAVRAFAEGFQVVEMR